MRLSRQREGKQTAPTALVLALKRPNRANQAPKRRNSLFAVDAHATSTPHPRHVFRSGSGRSPGDLGSPDRWHGPARALELAGVVRPAGLSHSSRFTRLAQKGWSARSACKSRHFYRTEVGTSALAQG